MGLNFRDDDPAFGIEDLDRGLDRRRGAVERKIENRAANRDDPPVKLPRSHRNHSLPAPASIFARRSGRGESNNNRAFVDISRELNYVRRAESEGRLRRGVGGALRAYAWRDPLNATAPRTNRAVPEAPKPQTRARQSLRDVRSNEV